MNRGALAHLAEPAGQIDDTGFPQVRTEKNRELLSSLRMRGETVQTNFSVFESGEPISLARGRAAQEQLVEVKSTEILPDGVIEVGEEGVEVGTQVTELLYLEDEFIVTNDTDSDFVHELVADATGSEVVSSELDLGLFAEEHPDTDIWLGGFYDHEGPVEKGVHIGDLNVDDSTREFINEAEINRLGVKNFSYNGRSMKFLLTESGYVDIYGGDVQTMEFVRFIHDIVTPHIVN